MPRDIESMRRREEELSKAVLHLSEKTNGFTDPRIVLIGGYALRVFIPFSRFTRDCDFIMRKKNGWNLDKLKQSCQKVTVSIHGYVNQTESWGFFQLRLDVNGSKSSSLAA